MADTIDRALVDGLDRQATYSAILAVACRITEIDRAIALWEVSRMLGRSRYQPYAGAR